MSEKLSLLERKPWISWIIFLGSGIAIFLLGLLAASIMERRTEALVVYKPKVSMEKFEPRNEKWGENFPREYTSWLENSETTFKSKFNGSGFRDALAEDPRLVILWAGYGFSKDYNQPRGHFYAIDDIRNTLRTGAPKNENEGPMPNTCWTCKSPDVPRVMQEVGIDEFYKGKWASRGHQIINPIGCADCHDPKTQALRISRPALIEAFERQGKDIEKATHQEKRSLVCAQCHVEYYFKGKDKYLTFPWDKGTNAEDMEAYYDEIGFSDWTHKLSKAPMIKAQHPGWETWKHGIHSKRGVACADCHMPYISEGGVKYTSHHVQSPLANINTSCQVCHRQKEEVLRDNVYTKQEKIHELRIKAEDILVKAHLEAKIAWDKGATKENMKEALQDIRHAQWRWDFAVASHGASFHASLEISRILSSSIEKASEARLKLARILYSLGLKTPPHLPDYSTKKKAQALVGLDMKKLNSEKDVFLRTLAPKWDIEGKKRQCRWDKGEWSESKNSCEVNL